MWVLQIHPTVHETGDNNVSWGLRSTLYKKEPSTSHSSGPLYMHPVQESYADTGPEINPTHFLCWQTEAASLTL